MSLLFFFIRVVCLMNFLLFFILYTIRPTNFLFFVTCTRSYNCKKNFSLNHTVGVFWLNAAETWMDVNTYSESLKSNVMEKIVNLVSGSTKEGLRSGANVHFMSETGILDVFFFLGPSFYDVLRQYSRVTGTTLLPPVGIRTSSSLWNIPLFFLQWQFFLFLVFFPRLPSKPLELQRSGRRENCGRKFW